MTISGEAIGRKMIRLAALRPTKRCRTSAKAARVPRMVATKVAAKAISMLRSTASPMPFGLNGCSQLPKVNSWNLYTFLDLLLSLKLIRTTTAIGTNV